MVVGEFEQVPADEDVPTFELDVLTAVAAGGAFVTVGMDSGVRVLVTPATTVIVVAQDDVVVVEPGGDDFPDLSYLDLDFDA